MKRNTINLSENISCDINFDNIKSSIIYVSYNIILPISFSSVVDGFNSEKRNTLLKNFLFSIIPACIILDVVMTVASVCISFSEQLISDSEMPFVTIVSSLGGHVSNVYSCILMCTMIVSSITTYYSLFREVGSVTNSIIGKKVKLFLLFACGILSCVGFSNFVEQIYPILAVLGGIIILMSLKRFVVNLLIVKRKKCII